MYDVIVIVGNGKTSRENVEALIDDYLYANKKLKFVLVKDGILSDGQRFAEQYLKEKNFDVRVEVEGTEFELSQEGESLAVFILWDDEDSLSASWLASAKSMGIPAFDLTNGLYELVASPDAKPITKPDIPKAEQLSEPEPVVDAEEEDEEDDEDGYEDPLYEAIRVIANIFAEEFKKALGK